MDRIEISEVSKNLANLMFTYNGNQEEEEVVPLIVDYMNYILDNSIDKYYLAYPLVILFKDKLGYNYLVNMLCEEFEKKVLRDYYNNSSGGKVEHCNCDEKHYNQNVKISKTGNDLTILNKEEIKLPPKGQHSKILQKKKVNGKDIVIGEYTIDSEGNIIDSISYEDVDVDLDEIYSVLDDLLVYDDKKYQTLISKNDMEALKEEAPDPTLDFASEEDL